MKSLLKSSNAQKIHKGDFNIDLNFPGLAVLDRTDKRGLGQLGRFDRGRLKPGVFVGMHPHVNDEILSYIRKGELVHEDTEGDKTIIKNTKIMMMNAGKGIYHQESIPDDGREVDMLQIFMRPSTTGLTPEVQFYDFDKPYSLNKLRLVAGPSNQDVPLKINSEVSVYDTRIDRPLDLPNNDGKTYVLYVFEGEINTQNMSLETGDLLAYDNENIKVNPGEQTDLVLFELDLNATYSREGMYSGV